MERTVRSIALPWMSRPMWVGWTVLVVAGIAQALLGSHLSLSYLIVQPLIAILVVSIIKLLSLAVRIPLAAVVGQ
jgi:hypothetical protein